MKKIILIVMTSILIPISILLLKELGYHPREIVRQTFYPNERDKNQKHRYDFPAENLGWKKILKTPVYGNESTGTIFDPYAYIDNNVLTICASERATSTIIKLESANGINWKKKATMLKGIKDSWEENVNRGCVIKTDSIYMLWYTGQHNGKSSIGVAKSGDGNTYYRILSKPIITADIPFEGYSVMNPCVIWDEMENIFKMWYSAGENYEPDVICYAESKDGISWKKYRQPVMEKLISHEWEKAKLGGGKCCKRERG